MRGQGGQANTFFSTYNRDRDSSSFGIRPTFGAGPSTGFNRTDDRRTQDSRLNDRAATYLKMKEGPFNGSSLEQKEKAVSSYSHNQGNFGQYGRGNIN